MQNIISLQGKLPKGAIQRAAEKFNVNRITVTRASKGETDRPDIYKYLLDEIRTFEWMKESNKIEAQKYVNKS